MHLHPACILAVLLPASSLALPADVNSIEKSPNFNTIEARQYSYGYDPGYTAYYGDVGDYPGGAGPFTIFFCCQLGWCDCTHGQLPPPGSPGNLPPPPTPKPKPKPKPTPPKHGGPTPPKGGGQSTESAVPKFLARNLEYRYGA